MQGKDEFAKFGNGRRNNISFTIDSGSSVTCHFKTSGADTATDKYFDLRQPGRKISISVNQLATITHIENKELKSPRTLGTAIANSFTEGFEWGQITVRADVDATTFEIYAS